MSLGELLLQARVKRGLSLDAISQATRVKPEVLAAIESGEAQHVPLVYLNGYIRSYARYLGLPQELVEKHVQSAESELPIIGWLSTCTPTQPK